MAIAPTLLLAMSRRHRASVQAPQSAAVSPTQPVQASHTAERSPSSPPDPCLHSAVCCCLFCEQAGTGEQAMRLVGGDYERFLAQVGDSQSPTISESVSPANHPALVRTVPHGIHHPSLPETRR